MIRFENVTKVYDGGVVALKDVTVDIAKGEFVFLVGPSGSGKSTMIRLMMREEAPSNGDIWVAGKHASNLPNWKVPHLRRSIGTVFQDFKLLPNKTVYENVAFAMEVTGKARSVIRTQVPQVLKLVGLSTKADRNPRQLSGGEQQRVSVARAFVNRPLILLADEPTGNLDPATSVGIMRILHRIDDGDPRPRHRRCDATPSRPARPGTSGARREPRRLRDLRSVDTTRACSCCCRQQCG